MISHKTTTASAVGSKTARACDNCVRKRARWYCAADDAFLCQSCDGTVHSANPLARRHERVRLKIASLKSLNIEVPQKERDPTKEGPRSVPSWHRGFTKKARTPRHGKPPVLSVRNPAPLVPEFGGDETSNEENDEQLLYRVPAYDPFEAELCSVKDPDTIGFDRAGSKEVSAPVSSGGGGGSTDVDHLHGFLPSEMDLAEFAADVESLLGKGLEDESFGMEGLGLMDCDIRDRENSILVKLEDDQEGVLTVDAVDAADHVDTEIDISKDTFELNFEDYDSPATCCEEDDGMPDCKDNVEKEMELDTKKRKEIFLKLDYESIITAWASQGSPWTSGERPDFNADDCWSDCLGICAAEAQNPYAELMGGYAGHMGIGDAAGREAKVSRYREKRRTRLFSKKIRYEVRKLNAEKRPRMKGRFVKRASFAGGPTPFPLLTK